MFGKIKQFFGFVGIEVKLDVPTKLKRDAQQITGKVSIGAKASQHITKVSVKYCREYSVRTNRAGSNNSDYETHTDDLGFWQMSDAFDIADGDFREVPFTLTITKPVSVIDTLKEQGGLMGSIGNVLGAINAIPNWTYYITTTVDVKGAAIDPSATTYITLED